MRLQNIKLLTGATLSVLLSVVALPALAKPVNVSQGSSNNQSTDMMNSSQSITGIVKSVDGNVARIQLPSGEVRNITLTRADMDRLNLKPGMRIVATMMPDGIVSVALANGSNQNTASTTTTDIHASGTNMAGAQGNNTNAVTSPANTTGINIAPGQSVTGTIISIKGENVVTLALPDGTTQDITVTRQVRSQLNLTPGMKITATRTASGDLTVAEGSGMQQNNSSTNTSGSDMSTTTTGGNMSSQQTITGTITNISGDTVTVQMPNGQTQDIMVDRALRDRLNLQVGTPITAMMMPDGSMTVSIANGMDQNTTSTNTTGQTQVTRRQTAYTRNYTRYSRNGNQQMMNQSQQTNQVQQNNTSMTGATPANRPVRGMW